MHFAGSRQGFQDQQIECSRRDLVSMQIITCDIAGLCQRGLVSSVCQDNQRPPFESLQKVWDAKSPLHPNQLAK
jgi:hypothetical protein